MVMREVRRHERGPQRPSAPDITRDLSADSASDSLHASFKAAHFDAEIERLRQLDVLEPTRFDMAIQMGGDALRATYYHAQDAIDPVPIIVAPGLGAFKAAMETGSHDMARLRRHVVTYDPALSEENWAAALHPRNLFNPSRLQQKMIVKVAQTIRDNPEVVAIRGGKGNEADTFDIAGWSWGNVSAVRAASWLARKQRNKGVMPRNVQSIAGAGNDGLGGWEQAKQHAGSVGNLLNRDVRKGAPRMIEVADDPEEFKRNAISHIVGGKGRIVGEAAYVVVKADVSDYVEDLHANGHLYGANFYTEDSLFPPEKVPQESLQMMDYVGIQPGEHSWFAMNPREAALGVVALSNVMAMHTDLATAMEQTNARRLG